MPTFKSAYKKKPAQRLLFVQPTMTEQSHKNECDINQIMAKYQRTGVCEHTNAARPQYQDIPSQDFHSAINFIKEAESTFNSLPSSLRKRFQNSPEKYLQFMEDPKNYEEMQKLGLTKTEYIPIEAPKEPLKPTKQEEHKE